MRMETTTQQLDIEDEIEELKKVIVTGEGRTVASHT